jgi:hypothetical protein
MTTEEFAKLNKADVTMHYPWNFGDSPADWIPRY